MVSNQRRAENRQPGAEAPASAERLERRIEARRLAAGYAGAYPFMISVRRQALSKRAWLPSDKQTAAIFRCMSRPKHEAPDPPAPELSRLQQAALDRERRVLSKRL